MLHALSRSFGALLTLALAALALAPEAARAQDYPSRPIHLVVPFGPGTTTDIVARVVGNGLSKALGQPLVVENRAGAGGSIGTNAVARAAPDGYTLTVGTVGTHAINVGLFSRLPYDPLKDFEPIALIGYTPTLLVVPASLPVKNAQELVALAKSRPQGISFASAGNGTSGHLAGELLKVRSGAPMQHVPYKEGGMAVTDVITGQVQFMFYHPAAVLPHMASGQLRAIGVSSARRSPAAPEVPTWREIGVDAEMLLWQALFVPAATAMPVRAALHAAVARVQADPALQRRWADLGVERAVALPPTESEAYVAAEVARWERVVGERRTRPEQQPLR